MNSGRETAFSKFNFEVKYDSLQQKNDDRSALRDGRVERTRGGRPAGCARGKVGEISRTEAKTYVGTVHGSETVDIVARINGVMWKSAFKEGSIVRKGDLLFQIEDTIYRENVNAAHAALDQNQAELNYAAKEKARYEKLYKSSATAQTTYENAIRTFKVSEAKTLEAKAKLVLAENDLSYTKIRAPLSGRIGRNVYSEGNYITPEKGTLATIVQFDPIEVRFAMSEADFFKYSKNGTLASDGLEIIRADSSAGSISDWTGRATLIWRSADCWCGEWF